MADGLTAKQISTQLGLSEHTVKFHVTNLRHKFATPNSAATVAVALRRGFIS